MSPFSPYCPSISFFSQDLILFEKQIYGEEEGEEEEKAREREHKRT